MIASELVSFYIPYRYMHVCYEWRHDETVILELLDFILKVMIWYVFLHYSIFFVMF